MNGPVSIRFPSTSRYGPLPWLQSARTSAVPSGSKASVYLDGSLGATDVVSPTVLTQCQAPDRSAESTAAGTGGSSSAFAVESGSRELSGVPEHPAKEVRAKAAQVAATRLRTERGMAALRRR